MRKPQTLTLIFLSLFVCVQVVFAFGLQPVKANWGNVPKAPTELGYKAAFLGDVALGHRMVATLLQNFGGSGGRVIALKDYNLDHVTQWLELGYKLEPRSIYLPFLAAYYFGGTQDPQQLRPIMEFLAEVGRGDGEEDWRWLSNAVFIARFKLGDNDRAIELANELASKYKLGRPALIAQMPAFIQLQMGEKEAAYNIMMELLKTSADDMHPNEVNFMIDYICKQTLEGVERENNPLCKDIK